MFRFRMLIVAVVAALLGVGLVSSPANALTKPTVSIKSNDYSVHTDTFIYISGKVSGKSAGATVRLQKYKNGAWVNVAKRKLKSSHKYGFTLKVTPTTTFRVHVSKTKKIAAANSKTITITTSGPPCGPGMHWADGGGPMNVQPGCKPDFH